MLETPRSSRIASAWTPFWPRWPSTTEACPRRKRGWSAPKRRRKSSKYSRAAGSRSIATKRPRPARSWASRAACPPAPKVASTTVSPGCTARTRRTSCARTGTWSVALGGKALGNMLGTPFDLLQLVPPRRAVPDLDVVVDPGDDDLAAQLGVLRQRRRHHHAPLLVELALLRAGEEEALHLPAVGAERIERGQPGLDEPLPVAARVRVEAAVHASGEHDTVAERASELRREREAVLVIDRVLVLAEKHPTSLDLLTTFPHDRPQWSTAQHFQP